MINDEVIGCVFSNELLIDAAINKILFDFHTGLIQVLFKKKGIEHKLEFSNICSVLINQFEDDGYLISTFKFFKIDDTFYFCFDPFSEDNIIEENDNNYIIAKSVVLE